MTIDQNCEHIYLNKENLSRYYRKILTEYYSDNFYNQAKRVTIIGQIDKSLKLANHLHCYQTDKIDVELHYLG